MSPCDARAASVMRCDVLASDPIEVRSQPVQLDARSASERRHGRLGTTNRWRRSGESSPTGTPFLVTTKDSPWSSWRIISPLLLRSSRWVISLATPKCGTCATPPCTVPGRGGRYRCGTRSCRRVDRPCCATPFNENVESIIGTLMMHAIAEAQPSSSQASMTKHPAMGIILSDVQHGLTRLVRRWQYCWSWRGRGYRFGSIWSAAAVRITGHGLVGYSLRLARTASASLPMRLIPPSRGGIVRICMSSCWPTAEG